MVRIFINSDNCVEIMGTTEHPHDNTQDRQQQVPKMADKHILVDNCDKSCFSDSVQQKVNEPVA